MKNKYDIIAPSTVITCAIFATALLLSACKQQMDKNELKASIEKANQAWMEAVKKQDASGVAGLYTEDAFILPPNAPAMQGREGIKGFFSAAMNAGIKDIRLVTEQVDGDQETAIERGAYEMRADGDKVVDQGKYLVHWKNINGKWMFQNDIFNSNMPSSNASLQKGNLIGVHVVSVKLNRGVTLNQYEEFYKNTVLPEFQKNWPEAKLYVIKGIRGDNKNSMGFLYFFESEDIRNKYFNEAGSMTEAGMVMVEKMRPILDQLDELYGTSTTKYTDWVIE